MIESTLAWDRRRVLAEYRVDERSLDRRTFQGSLAIEEHRLTESSGETRQSFVVDDKPDLIFQQVFEHTWSSWGRATRFFGPRPWWRSLHESEPAEVVLPPRLVLSGPEPYRGHDCYRVESPWGRRYFVRAGDRRLAGQQHVSFAGGPAAELALKGQAAGRAFATFPEWAAWLASLDESRRDQVEQREEALRRERSLVVFERCYDDYREIAAGCWLPFAQLARSFDVDSGKSIVRAESATEIAELSVNQPLPDAVFAHEIPEGAVVSTDWRYQVPIHYSYSTAQTEGDRQRLAAQQAAARDESQNIFDGIKSAIDLRLGQAPPELPREGWIGSRPLDWQGLRGKAVALVFWDIGCGPCHGTLDLLETSAKNAALYGQAVVAVHRAIDDRSAVENELAKRGWTMPVVIDGDGKSAAQASLFEALGIEAMPWVVVVDRQGRVAAHDHGSLGSTIFRHFGELSK